MADKAHVQNLSFAALSFVFSPVLLLTLFGAVPRSLASTARCKRYTTALPCSTPGTLDRHNIDPFRIRHLATSRLSLFTCLDAYHPRLKQCILHLTQLRSSDRLAPPRTLPQRRKAQQRAAGVGQVFGRVGGERHEMAGVEVGEGGGGGWRLWSG